MGALVSLAVSALGGWPLALAKGAWSALVEMVKTPIGAAVVAGLVCLWIGDHRGADRVETRHAAAAEHARIIAAARSEADAEIARETGRGLALSRRSIDLALEEIRNAPLPAPRPGDACVIDASRVLRIGPHSAP